MRLILLHAYPAIPNIHFLLIAMMSMVGALLFFTGFMLLYLLSKRKREKKLNKWRDRLDHLIQRVIYFEPSGDAPPFIPIPFRIARGLKQPLFRQLLVNALVQGKRGLSGTAGANLVLLFNQLQLGEDARQKLKSRKWHLQAQGIQEVAMMEQRQFLRRIYRLTNTNHELVRMEAQSAIVQLYGFEGLRFLDIIDHPISEWQQIKLLRILSRAHGALPDKISNWLSSTNESVRIFALKLVAEHHRQELHEAVIDRLQDDSDDVRLQAVRCLREIYTYATTQALIHVYGSQTEQCRLTILETLGHIGSEEDNTFLNLQLGQEGNKLRLEAARSLAKIGGTGLQYLGTYPSAHLYPWNEIIQQAKTELTK